MINGRLFDASSMNQVAPDAREREEFFFQLPFEEMDRFWYGFENEYPPGEVAEVMGETEERVEALFRNFERKRQTTEYLRMAPIRDYYGR